MTVVYENNTWCVGARIISFMLQNEQFQYFPKAYDGRGNVTDLNSDDLRTKSEISKMRVFGSLLFSFTILRKIACQ